MDQSTLDDDHFAYCYDKPRKTDIATFADVLKDVLGEAHPLTKIAASERNDLGC